MKNKYENIVAENLESGEELIGYFYATQNASYLWLLSVIIIGPFAAVPWVFRMKHYTIAITNQNIYLHRLNMFGKLKTSEKYKWDQVIVNKIGKNKGLSLPLIIFFKNINKVIKFKVSRVARGAKLDSHTYDYIVNRLQTEIRASL